MNMSEEVNPDELRKESEEDTSCLCPGRSSLLLKIVDEYERRGNKTEAEDIRAEAAALMLCDRGDSFPGYYQPMATFTNGATVPSLTFFLTEVLSKLENRAKTSRNPILASRFADVVWDLSAVKNPEMARIAVDKYLECVDIYKDNSWGLELATCIKRSVQIANMINDAQRLTRVKEIILKQMRELDADKDYRFCIDLASAITLFKKTEISESEGKEVKSILNQAAKYYQAEHDEDDSKLGPVGGPNEHFVRAFHESIIQLGSKKHLPNVDSTFHRVEIARSHEREGDNAFSNRNYLAAVSFYRSAERCFRDLGLAGERDRIRVKLANAGIKTEENLKPIETETEIETIRIEEYIKPLIADSIEETLQRIASAPQFIPSVKGASRLAKELKAKHPIRYLISHTVLHEGHVINSPSTEDEILHQSITTQLVMDIHIGNIFLTHLFNKLISEYGVNAEIFTKHFEN